MISRTFSSKSLSSFFLPENLPGDIVKKRRGDKAPANESLVFAPGEGQIPANILKEKHPFVMHFPSLYPDGKCGLHDPERRFRLTPQQYLMQRIQNINPMFAENKAFLFSAVYYIERHQLESKMNISYRRGKIKQNLKGAQFLKTEDGFGVFDNIRGSPRYWQKLRYDLLAKLEQCGPFQFFYTLSCANKRWYENLATILTKRNANVIVLHRKEEETNDESVLLHKNPIKVCRKKEESEYSDEDEINEVEEEVNILKDPLENDEEEDRNEIKEKEEGKQIISKSNYFVHEKIQTNSIDPEYHCKYHLYEDGWTCKRYNLSDYDKKDKNKLLDENVLDITRNFNHRLKSFRKNILMAPQSPMHINHYQDRIEFQCRGYR